MRDFDLWDAYIKWADDGVDVCRTHALISVGRYDVEEVGRCVLVHAQTE